MVDKLIALKEKYPDFVVNGVKQLSLMKGNWGGVGTTPVHVSFLGHTLVRSHGKGEATVLHR